MKRSLTVLALLLATPAAWASGSADFTVLRDGTPIGHHRVLVSHEGEETRVEVDIALNVSLGFIPLYRYRHQSREVWRNDRLTALDSTTDDNGEQFRVTARAVQAGLQVTAGSQTLVLPDDTVPTSYWNPSLISGRTVLDSQEGRRLDLSVTPAAPGRWQLRGDVNLDIGYDQQGQWTGLWFRHTGSDFTYVPRAMAERRP